MEISVYESLLCLPGQVDVAAHIGILEAELSRLAVGNLLSVLSQEEDPGVHLRAADRAGCVGLVDPEKPHREPALRAGIDIDQVQSLDIGVVGGLAPDEEHPQEGGLPASQHPHIGGREEGDRDLFCQKESGQSRRILDGLIGRDIVPAPENIQRRKDHNDGGHKVQGRQGRESIFFIEQKLSVLPDRQNGPLKISVFVQDALGIPGRA